MVERVYVRSFGKSGPVCWRIKSLTEDKADKAYGTRLRLCGVFTWTPRKIVAL